MDEDEPPYKRRKITKEQPPCDLAVVKKQKPKKNFWKLLESTSKLTEISFTCYKCGKEDQTFVFRKCPNPKRRCCEVNINLEKASCDDSKNDENDNEMASDYSIDDMIYEMSPDFEDKEIPNLARYFFKCDKRKQMDEINAQSSKNDLQKWKKRIENCRNMHLRMIIPAKKKYFEQKLKIEKINEKVVSCILQRLDYYEKIIDDYLKMYQNEQAINVPISIPTKNDKKRNEESNNNNKIEFIKCESCEMNWYLAIQWEKSYLHPYCINNMPRIKEENMIQFNKNENEIWVCPLCIELFLQKSNIFYQKYVESVACSNEQLNDKYKIDKLEEYDIDIDFNKGKCLKSKSKNDNDNDNDNKNNEMNWQVRTNWNDLSYHDKMQFVLSQLYDDQQFKPLFINWFNQLKNEWNFGCIVKIVQMGFETLIVKIELYHKNYQRTNVFKYLQLFNMESYSFHLFRMPRKYSEYDYNSNDNKLRINCLFGNNNQPYSGISQRRFLENEFDIEDNRACLHLAAMKSSNKVSISKSTLISVRMKHYDNDDSKKGGSKSKCQKRVTFNKDQSENEKNEKGDIFEESKSVNYCRYIYRIITFEQIKHTKKFFIYYLNNIKSGKNERLYKESLDKVKQHLNKSYSKYKGNDLMNSSKLRDCYQFNGCCKYFLPIIEQFSKQLCILPFELLPSIDVMCLKTDYFSNNQPFCQFFITKYNNFYKYRFNDTRLYIKRLIWCNPPYNKEDIRRVCGLFETRHMRGYLCVPDWPDIENKYMTCIVHSKNNNIVKKYQFKSNQISKKKGNYTDLFFGAHIWGSGPKFNVNVWYIDCRRDCDAHHAKPWTQKLIDNQDESIQRYQNYESYHNGKAEIE